MSSPVLYVQSENDYRSVWLTALGSLVYQGSTIMHPLNGMGGRSIAEHIAYGRGGAVVNLAQECAHASRSKRPSSSTHR